MFFSVPGPLELAQQSQCQTPRARQPYADDAMRRHPHPQRVVATLSVDMPQGEMGVAAIDFALVSNHAEFAISRTHQCLTYFMYIALVLHAVADQFRHSQHFQTVSVAELDQIWNPGHGAVFTHDLADDSCGD